MSKSTFCICKSDYYETLFPFFNQNYKLCVVLMNGDALL